MDPLVEEPRSRWPEIRDSFRRWWPHGITGFYTLDYHIQRPGLSHAFQFKIFSPYGDFQNGVVGWFEKEDFQEVLIFTQSENTEKLAKALLTSKVIDWTGFTWVPCAEEDEKKLLRSLYHRLGLQELEDQPSIKHMRSKDSLLYETTKCHPKNTYTGSLNQKHVEQVDKIWPYRHDSSHKTFAALIRHNPSYGLFSEEDDRLLAWVLINEAGYLNHLYCEEEHRRKGYAEFIIKIATNDLLRQGKDVLACTAHDNEGPFRLLQKLGFDIIGSGSWLYLTKEQTTNPS